MNINTTDARFKQLVQDCHAVWQQIAPDAEEAAKCCGEPMTNYVAAEMCLDADRLTIFLGAQGVASRAYVRETALAGGFTALCAAVAKELDYYIE